MDFLHDLLLQKTKLNEKVTFRSGLYVPITQIIWKEIFSNWLLRAMADMKNPHLTFVRTIGMKTVEINTLHSVIFGSVKIQIEFFNVQGLNRLYKEELELEVFNE